MPYKSNFPRSTKFLTRLEFGELFSDSVFPFEQTLKRQTVSLPKFLNFTRLLFGHGNKVFRRYRAQATCCALS